MGASRATLDRQREAVRKKERAMERKSDIERAGGKENNRQQQIWAAGQCGVNVRECVYPDTNGPLQL